MLPARVSELRPRLRSSTARGVVLASLTMALLFGSSRAHAQVLADGRDAWTLLERHLVNRQLFEQIRADAQTFRLGRNLDPLAAAADVRIGTQQPLDGGAQSRFHGLYVLNTFGAVR